MRVSLIVIRNRDQPAIEGFIITGRRNQPDEHPWIQQHGDVATVTAREMVEKMRRVGDAEGTDTWLRIIVAIGTLGAPSTEARH